MMSPTAREIEAIVADVALPPVGLDSYDCWVLSEFFEAATQRRRPEFSAADWRRVSELKVALSHFAAPPRVPPSATLPTAARQVATRPSSLPRDESDWMSVNDEMCEVLGVRPRRVRQLLSDHQDAHPNDDRLRKHNRAWSAQRGLVEEIARGREDVA